MDPVTAFALAGTILQFIDAGAKFAGLAWNIYHSVPTSSETRDHLDELAKITQSLEDVLGPLSSRPNHPSHEEQDNGLADLADECKGVVQQLVSLLHKLGFPNHPPGRKRDALKAALQATWHKSEIESLRSRLDGFRAQFNIHLLVSLRQYATQNLSRQEETLHRLHISSENNSRIEGTVNSILEFLASKARFSDGVAVQSGLRSALITEIYQKIDRPATSPVLTPEVQQLMEQLLLSTLRYEGMEDREARISKTYSKTFEWVFRADEAESQNWHSLKSWLESEAQIYWITGKPGSGKSTLMKYLCEKPAPRCKQFLAKGAASKDVVIASFYFWNSDTQVQMSCAGLWRSLLYQILEHKPHLIPIVFPSRWEALSIFGRHEQSHIWKEGELQSALETVVKLVTTNSILCLFIDGLDEFDGTPEVLVALVKALTQQSPFLKICVASRPWVTFEAAFETKPHLRLEDLTYNDIKHFVTSKFQSDPEFAKLRLREPEFADQLIENIVSKASGVFLWVHLVVASLNSGLSFGDRIVDLQKRLDLLPPELEQLYDKMLRNLEPFYLQHAAQLLMIMEASTHFLPLIILSFADEETVASVIKMPIVDEMDAIAMDLRSEAMRRRLNSRLKGLLQVYRASDSDITSNAYIYVQYLHRTVRDFVRKRRVQEFLQSYLETPFDPNLSLCVGYYAYIKKNLMGFNLMGYSNPEISLMYSLQYAAKVTLAHRDSAMQIADDMANNLPGTRALVRSFLSLAVHMGLTFYVGSRTDGPCLVPTPTEREWPLLMDACSYPVKLDMVELLLKFGADPNYRAEGYGTPWEMLLAHYGSTSNVNITSLSSLEKEERSVVELMVSYGADVKGARPRSLETFKEGGSLRRPYIGWFTDSFYKELQDIQLQPGKGRQRLGKWLAVLGRR